jgi:hypothetical protein
VFARLERGLEALFEGSFLRIFRPQIQPAEIAKRLERSMEANRQAAVGKVFGPNYFEALLSPRDFEAYERSKDYLERELSVYLYDRAKELNLSLITRPQVALAAHPDVRRGSVQVRSWLQDAPTEETERQFDFTQPIEIPRARPREPLSATLTVVSGELSGQRHSVPPGRVHLGRDLGNQIVLEDSRVSRKHAEIYLRGADWYLRDLGSTNGTYVNGYAIKERALETGDRVSLGGVELVFQTRQ